MKLLRCYVSGFGNITDYTYIFNDGLNVVCENNGWGKSTFAAFIKCMFYGFSGAGKRDVAQNERRKYQPWSGAPFGGNVEFTVGNKTYLVERSFGTKESADKFALYSMPDRLTSVDFGENIGLELFGIDAPTFERSVFCSEASFSSGDSGVNQTISAKLNDLIETPDDVQSLDKALKRLDERRKYYKMTGDRGRISDIHRELYDCENNIRECRSAADRCEVAQEKIACVDREISTINVELDKASEILELIADEETLAEKRRRKAYLTELADSLNSQKTEIITYFSGNVPDVSEIDTLFKQNREYEMACLRLNSVDLAENQQKRLYELNNIFADGIPDDEELDYVIETESKIELQREQRSEIKSKISEREKYVSKNFEELEKVSKQTDAYIGMLSDFSTDNRTPKNGKLFSLIGILFAFLTALSLLFISFSTILGVTLAALFLISAAICLVYANYCKKYNRRITEDLPVREKIKDFVEQGGISCKNIDNASLSNALMLLRMQISDVRGYAQELSTLNDSLSICNSRIDVISGVIAEFECKYPKLTATYDFNSIKKLKQEYIYLREMSQNSEQQKEAYKENCSKLESALTCDFERITHRSLVLKDIGTELDSIKSKVVSYVDICKQAETVCHDLDIFGEVESPKINLDDFDKIEIKNRVRSLTVKLDDIQRERINLEHSMKNDTTISDMLVTYVEKKDILTAELEASNKALEIIEKTRTYLEEANRTLSRRYLTLIQESFDSYLKKLIPDNEVSKVNMNADLDLSVQECGMSRKLALISRGRQDIISVAARFALVDALFKEEQPFMILDDPFVNLDDTRCAAVLELLRTISGDRQVIYLTCSTSRVIKNADL